MQKTVCIALLAITAVLSSSASWAQAEKRVALVIGNAAYKEQPLKNPVNDARLMAARLREVGFDVVARENATRDGMGSAVREFVGKLAPGSVALIYYAGHGIQSRGRNYLIPVDATLSVESDLGFQAVEISLLIAELDQAQARVNFVILDACRNNPFERRMRGASRGLAAVDAARGALIAYATSPGSVALDGEGANGTYTEELAKALTIPNLKAEEVFKRVTAAVEDRTKGQQTPWISSSLRGDFVFKSAAIPQTTATTPVPAAIDRETVFWQSAQASGRREDFEAYLRQFPNGTFAELAANRIRIISPPAASPASLPPPSVDELAGNWKFGRAKGTFLYGSGQLCSVMLNRDQGKHGFVLKGCGHPNESYWRTSGHYLEFLHADGSITTRFSKIGPSRWEGAYLGRDPHAPGVVHYLSR
ncbi:MAG: caspase family protein [Rhodospirillales bacterium]